MGQTIFYCGLGLAGAALVLVLIFAIRRLRYDAFSAAQVKDDDLEVSIPGQADKVALKKPPEPVRVDYKGIVYRDDGAGADKKTRASAEEKDSKADAKPETPLLDESTAAASGLIADPTAPVKTAVPLSETDESEAAAQSDTITVQSGSDSMLYTVVKHVSAAKTEEKPQAEAPEEEKPAAEDATPEPTGTEEPTGEAGEQDKPDAEESAQADNEEKQADSD